MLKLVMKPGDLDL